MKRLFLSVLAVAVVLSVVGCAGTQINKEAVMNVKRAGVLSLTMVKSAPSNAENNAVMQQAADYALAQAEYQLKSARLFTVVPSASLAKVPAYYYAGTMSKAAGALRYFKDNPDAMITKVQGDSNADFMTALKEGLQAASAAGEARKNPAAAAQKVLDDHKELLIGAKGVPFVPYTLFNNAESGTTIKYVNGERVTDDGENQGLKMALLEQAKAVCAAAKLDAVIVVMADTLLPPPQGVRVIVGKDRVVGTVKVDMTMVMIDKTGEIIADFERPVMDDLAPMKLARPTYKAVTWRMSGGKNWPDKIEPNLADPSGEILRDFKELSAEAAKRMANKLKEELTKE
ncbi:MAG: hypothetical protein JXR81_06060 [Candidatus Goldbacteria bacterium]|nr:hypothetical protein [Candidatus Goldiibacteriota bacterium]